VFQKRTSKTPFTATVKQNLMAHICDRRVVVGDSYLLMQQICIASKLEKEDEDDGKGSVGKQARSFGEESISSILIPLSFMHSLH
jgi:hypothetical protein